MTSLRTVVVLCVVLGLVTAEERRKRQAYDGNYGGAAAYRQPPQQGYAPQQGYQQQQGYGGGGHQPAQQQYAPQPAHKPPRQHGGGPVEEDDKDPGPHPLQLILENSKFECGSKSDGYYADSGVGCQAFHYCVSGQKHSMMCPGGTVFHQVHLNCVPQDQDICNKADKFFFVNDYLNRPVDKGPNNTVVWAQRYYPENYAVGDPFIPPQEAKKDAPAATYGLGPAYRVQQQGPEGHDYRQQQPAPVHHPQNPSGYAPHLQQQPPVHRPQSAPYTPQAPPQVYQQRPVHQPAPQQQSYGYGAPQAQAYNSQAQSAQRAYNQQQYQALGPQQQQLYGADAGQRQRYAQQY